ncbi:Ammonium transporter 2 member 4 [Linum grandiflorum]
MGWSGFNGGGPFAASIDASLAILNTHVCTSVSLLMWILLDSIFFGKPSVIGAVQGMIAGLVCITPAAVMVLHKRLRFLTHADDPMAIFHTHAIAGSLGGILTGIFAVPKLCRLFFMVPEWERYIGLAYALQNNRSMAGFRQLGIQLVGIGFIAVLNVVVTTLICWLVGLIVPLYVGDYAAHEEEAFALCADVDGATAGNSKPGSPYENYASRSYENYSKDRSYASDSKGGHVPERRYEHPMMSPVSEEQSPYHGDGRRYVNSLYDVDDLFAQSKSIQMV